MKITLGVLGNSSFFRNKVVPALSKSSYLALKSIASKSLIQPIKGLKSYEQYDDLLIDEDINAVYIPLPNSLHFEWALKALENNNHVIVEKPLSLNLKEAEQLIKIANSKKLVLMETFQFRFHEQMKFIKKVLIDESLGALKKINICFGIPALDSKNIRHDKALGGGSFYDLGVYGLRMITELFGKQPELVNGLIKFNKEYEVDTQGNINFFLKELNLPIEIDFGFDNEYKSSLEIWGSGGILNNDRIFTAPSDEKVKTVIKRNNIIESHEFCDDQILNLFNRFSENIHKDNLDDEYQKIYTQAEFQEKTYEQLKKI